jgi:hypothetical protein
MEELYVAANRGDVAAMRAALDDGADVNAPLGNVRRRRRLPQRPDAGPRRAWGAVHLHTCDVGRDTQHGAAGGASQSSVPPR